MKDETGEKVLQLEIMQNHDARMLLADAPDRMVIARVVAHLIKRDVGVADFAPGRTTSLVVQANRAARRDGHPLGGIPV